MVNLEDFKKLLELIHEKKCSYSNDEIDPNLIKLETSLNSIMTSYENEKLTSTDLLTECEDLIKKLFPELGDKALAGLTEIAKEQNNITGKNVFFNIENSDDIERFKAHCKNLHDEKRSNLAIYRYLLKLKNANPEWEKQIMEIIKEYAPKKDHASNNRVSPEFCSQLNLYRSKSVSSMKRGVADNTDKTPMSQSLPEVFLDCLQDLKIEESSIGKSKTTNQGSPRPTKLFR